MQASATITPEPLADNASQLSILLSKPSPTMSAKSLLSRINRFKAYLQPKSLRNQLIISVWLGMGAILIPFNIYTVLRDRDYAITSTQQRLLAEGTLASSALARWERSISDLLEVIAFTPSVRSLSQQDAQTLFDQISIVFPERAFRLWTPDGELIASTDTVRPASRQLILARPYFQMSMQGSPGWGIFPDCLTRSACYVRSTAVLANDKNPLSTPSTTPVGVLSTVINLTDTGKDSGMDSEVERLKEDPEFTALENKAGSERGFLSLQNNDFRGFEVLMVSRDGNVIFPLSKINDRVSVLKPSEIANGPWGPLIKAGQQSTEAGQFQEVESKKHMFLTYSRRIDAIWSIVAVSDKASALDKVHRQVIQSAIRQLIILGLITLVIIIVCRNAARPIQVAAAAVRQFSFGNFDAEITSNRNDEIGELYEGINQTGRSLRSLLKEKLAHAVTDKQIQIAADIQKEFVIETLPSTSHVELAADFDPAYEVGADWYDAISIGNLTYIVIADVCDKGIASALFMSVFQSLLHYSLLEESSDDEEYGASAVILKSITQVNNYMATKHGHSAMFATLFLGAYDQGVNRLSYVTAGHESPLIVRSKGVTETLDICGPAVGIFPGAKYTVKHADLNPGEILFTYTDGLIDARSPSGESWGIERVKTLLSLVEPAMMTANEVMASAIKQVNHHRADAEQFDDMTLLVMKVNL
jgi:sigma-B regulation protein RsbU (phosphoserine phosphatase)